VSTDEARWVAALQPDAPDVVACWQVSDRLRPLRRELRARVQLGDAAAILRQEDWNAAQAFAHTTAARRFLAAWAALSASGEWPAADPPRVRPSIPGRPDATRDELLVLLDKSRRSLRESAAKIAGHELERCPLEHPMIGRLRCGEWLVFVGVHDLMHLEQLHRLQDPGERPAVDRMGWRTSSR
jgi:hypothetical protein